MTTIVMDIDNGSVYTDTRVTHCNNVMSNKAKIHIPRDSYIEYNGARYNVLAYGVCGTLPDFNKELLKDLVGVDMYAWIRDHIEICWYDRDRVSFVVLCELDDGYYGFKIELVPSKPISIHRVSKGLIMMGSGSRAAGVYHRNYPNLTAMEIVAMIVRLNIDKHSGGFISGYNAKSGNYVTIYDNTVAKEKLSSARKKIISHVLS